VLFVAAIAGGAGRPVIDSDFVVEPSGSVALGPQYGRAKIAGLTLEDAEKAVTAHLKQTLREPMVQITIGGWRDSTMSTARRNRSPSASQRAVQANSDATSTRREAQQTRELADLASRIAADQPALPLPWEQHPFPWEQQNPQPQVSNARRIGSYRDLIPAASSPSVTESIGVLKKIVERSEQDYIRVRELAEKNAVSAAEVGRAKSEYEISVERLRQGERALKYHQAVLAVEEADYQMLDEANRHAPGSVSESALRRAKLAVELARAKLEELAE
jgi:hypothetical protein